MSFTIAADLEEALTAMANGAKPIAGGTDLVVGARGGKAPLPKNLVAIDRIAELTSVTSNERFTRIGALVTHATLMSHKIIVEQYSALADSSALVGSPATRNVGTLGGNVMNASPAMDTGAPLMVLGATAQLDNLKGPRPATMEQLWTGPGQTNSDADELCTYITLPARPDHSGSAYVRLEYRRAMEIAVVGAAASVTVGDDGTLASLAVALTAVAPTILTVSGTDSLLGLPPDETTMAAIAELASEQANPISDLRASERYRRHTVGVMARRATEAAYRRAKGEVIPVPVNRTLGIGASR